MAYTMQDFRRDFRNMSSPSQCCLAVLHHTKHRRNRRPSEIANQGQR